MKKILILFVVVFLIGLGYFLGKNYNPSIESLNSLVLILVSVSFVFLFFAWIEKEKDADLLWIIYITLTMICITIDSMGFYYWITVVDFLYISTKIIIILSSLVAIITIIAIINI